MSRAGSRRHAAGIDYREMLAQLQPEIVGRRGTSTSTVTWRWPPPVPPAGSAREKLLLPDAGRSGRIAACREAGTKLAIAHRNRYHPAIPVVRQALESGEIGELLEIRGRGREDQRGGVQDLWVLGTHIFDMTRCFGGDARACSAVLLQDGRPATPADVRPGDEGVGPIAGNQLHARFEMSSGVPAYFDSIRNRVDPDANFGLQLIGNKGLIDIRIDAEPLAHLVPGNPFRPTVTPRQWIPITSAGVGRSEPIPNLKSLVEHHVYAARDLLAAIKESRAPLSSETDGRAIVEMTHAVLCSHVHNGERVVLPLKERGHAFDGWR
ncbi:MAG: gfo/Idh/MocA family oxidoreductase [Planctomycetaceae bacterium]